MLLLVYLFIPVVFASPTIYETKSLDIKGFSVTIVNNILKSVKKTSNSINHLNLSGLSLDGIDRRAFNDLTNVSYLDLSNNHLKELQQLIFLEFGNLKHLSLAKNPITLVKNNFVGLDKLEILDISNIQYWDSDSLFGLSESTRVLNGPNTLTVSSASRKNKFEPYILLCMNKDTVQSVQPSDNITTLRADAKYCETAELLDYIMINRRTLILSHKSISKFAKGWYQLEKFPGMSTLDLSSNEISNITREILNDLPVNLIRVILHSNKIQSLNKGIIDNRNLQILDLKYNAIRKIERKALRRTNLVELALSGNKLRNNKFAKTLPSSNLTNLLIDYNNITELLPDFFATLTNLKYLNLEGNMLVNLTKKVFNGLDSVRRLNIANNKLENINRDSFYGLSDNMTELRLSYNNIERLPRRTFNNLPAVEVIDLSYNKISVIKIGNLDLPNLTILKLNNNLVKRLGYGTFVGSPKGTIKLRLGGNNTKRLQKRTFNNLPAVEVIDLSYNKIRVIQIEDFNLPKLRTLMLNNNLLTTLGIDTFVGSPKGTTERWLDDNKTEGLQRRTFINLPAVQLIDLSYNKISEIKIGSFILPKLKILRLNNNLLTTLGIDTFVSSPKGTTELCIGDNKTEELQRRTFINLPAVQLIDLSYNKISEIKFGSFNLPKLTSLKLNNNLLTRLGIDTFVSSPKGTTELCLGGNKTEESQRRTFINLPAVQLIDLSYNQISEIEVGTFNLTKLRTLKLNNNLLMTLGIDTFVGSPKGITIDVEQNPIKAIGKIYNKIPKAVL